MMGPTLEERVHGLMSKGDLAATLKEVDAAIAQKPRDKEALRLRASLHALSEDWRAVVADLSALVSLQPKARLAGAKATAAQLADKTKKSATYETIAEAQAKAGDIAGAEKTNAIKAQFSLEIKVTELAREEMVSWQAIYLPPERAIFPDWQTFSASLKNKKPDEAADAVIEVVKNLAESFQTIRINEAKWKKLRTQSNR
jgi:hypothetical protein